MAGPSYPTGLKGRPGQRPLSGLGTGTLRGNPDTRPITIDLRSGGGGGQVSRPSLGVDLGTGKLLHGDILGPGGRPLDSSKAATVRSMVRDLVIEGELGRPGSAKARRIMDVLKKILGRAHPFFNTALGLASLLESMSTTLQKAGSGPWTHPDYSLLRTCFGGQERFQVNNAACNGLALIGNDAAQNLKTNPNDLPVGAAAITSFGQPYFVSGSSQYYRVGYVWLYDGTATPGASWRAPTAVYSSSAELLGTRLTGLGATTTVGGQPRGERENERPGRNVTRRPYVVPASQIVDEVITGTRNPPNRPRPPLPPTVDHPLVPPGKNEKERKKRISPALLAAVSTITEACEVVDIAYKALPWQRRRWKGRDGQWRDKQITCHQRAIQVFRYALEIDMDAFVDGIKWNMVEDALYGTLGKAKGATGRSVDLSRLPNFL